MKNLIKILLVSFMFVALAATGVQAQDKSATLDYDETQFIFNFGARDSIGISDSVYTINVRKKNTMKADCYAYFDLDKVASGSSTCVILQKGKVLPSEAYTTINTVTWHLTADTTFTMNAASKDYEYYQYTITGQLDEVRATVEALEVKFVEQ